jgi:endoglucanase
MLSATAFSLRVLAGLAVAVTGLLPDIAAAFDSPTVCEASAPPVLRPRVEMLARGFNLTGWLDSVPARPPDLAVLASLRQRGFTHIRLPVTAERLMEVFSNRDTIARELFDLDRAIGALMRLGYAVSLDLHPGDRLGDLHVAAPDQAFELIDALWRSLARRYSVHPKDRLFFEVLNEPKVAAGVWNRQGPLLVETIRREAPEHTIIYGPANFQRIDALVEMAPLPDPNVVYAVHFYDPMIFTHQGLDWSNDPVRDVKGMPFPTRLSDPRVATLVELLTLHGKAEAAALVKRQLSRPWTEERIVAEMAQAAAWSERYHRPVIINEFGTLAWQAPPADRARWIRTVRSAAEARCIGWAHWDYADAFGFMRRVGEREVPDEAILDALLGSRIH